MAYETIFFDFNGVLSKDRFYAGLEKDYPHVSNFIETEVFGKDSNIPNKWMRGEKNSVNLETILT